MPLQVGVLDCLGLLRAAPLRDSSTEPTPGSRNDDDVDVEISHIGDLVHCPISSTPTFGESPSGASKDERDV